MSFLTGKFYSPGPRGTKPGVLFFTAPSSWAYEVRASSPPKLTKRRGWLSLFNEPGSGIPGTAVAPTAGDISWDRGRPDRLGVNASWDRGRPDRLSHAVGRRLRYLPATIPPCGGRSGRP